jgi:hypothetical protein
MYGEMMKERNYDKWLLIPDEGTRLPTDIGGIHIQKLKTYLDSLEARIEQLEKELKK